MGLNDLINMNDSILIIVAHPDDEVLGCGGTIARFSNEGKIINVAFLADGVFSRAGISEVAKEELKNRRQAAIDACKLIGVNEIVFGDFPDNQMDSVPLLEISKFVENLIKKFDPITIFTHHIGDVNIDHQLIHKSVMIACRPQHSNNVKEIYFFETASSTEWQFPGSSSAFVPNTFFDISSTLQQKIKALEIYHFEMREWPHPRSLKGVQHLAQWRGATIGVNAAEAFILGRQIK